VLFFAPNGLADGVIPLALLVAPFRNHHGLLALFFAEVGDADGVLLFDHAGLGNSHRPLSLFFSPFRAADGALTSLFAGLGDPHGSLAFDLAPGRHHNRFGDFLLASLRYGSVDSPLDVAIRGPILGAITNLRPLFVADAGRWRLTAPLRPRLVGHK